jgi:hypothetical protein
MEQRMMGSRTGMRNADPHCIEEVSEWQSD